MILGNAAWGLRETPLEEQFRITAKMGLNALEIGIANAPLDIPLDVTEERLSEIKKISTKYNVKMIAGATGNDFLAGNDDVPKIKRVIDICKALEIEYLRIFAGFAALDDVSEEMFEGMTSALCEVCEYAREKGVVPMLETHGGVTGYDDGVEHFMSTTTDLEILKKIVNALPDNVRICYDPANLYAVGIKSPETFYEKIKDKVVYAHFKDFKSMPSGHIKPTYCGDSGMDWDKILCSMKDFDGYAVFEYENTEDIEEGLLKSYNYIKERSSKNE